MLAVDGMGMEWSCGTSDVVHEPHAKLRRLDVRPLGWVLLFPFLEGGLRRVGAHPFLEKIPRRKNGEAVAMGFGVPGSREAPSPAVGAARKAS